MSSKTGESFTADSPVDGDWWYRTYRQGGTLRVVPPFYREGEGLLDYVRERTAQAKYPAAMLAELYAAGEINQEQYERLRMERT